MLKEKLRILLMSTSFFAAINVIPLSTISVQAEETNQQLTGALYSETQGRSYWPSSNLREWLNSDQDVVFYTNQAPSRDKLGNYAYDSEPGFLTNFTEEEKNAIAVTEHRVLLSSSDLKVRDGGSHQPVTNIYYGESMTFALVNILNNYKTLGYKLVNDKVFLLNDWEAYQFIQQRGWKLEKTITPEAKAKNSYYSNSISWWINGPTENIGNEYSHTIVNDLDSVRNATPRTARGVAPALSLKPDYVLSNGKKARDLQSGEIVEFGHYLGKPIKWRVININDENFPLLLTEHIIDIKPYDAPGDRTAYEHSKYIHFPIADTSIKNYDYRSTTQKSDVKPPVVRIINGEDMEKRQNGEFVLDIEVVDDLTGVDYVVLPNGNITTNTRFNYTISENKNYIVRAMDKAGNMKIFTIPIGNINPPSSVKIEPSANGWTNKDVTVDIFASNDVGFTRSVLTQPSRDLVPYSFPNFTSYTGKRFRISGSVELIKADKDVGNLRANIGFHYHTRQKIGDDYIANYTWVTGWSTSLKELQEKGEIPFDFEYTIGGNYYRNLHAWSQIPVPSAERAYTLRWKNVTYELLDDDDFKIEKIVLPNGNEVFSNSYQDVLTEEGTYTYRVIDNRGKVTEKDVTVWIDKVKPTMRIDYNKEVGQKDIVLNISVSDDRSGVKEVILPNGSKTSQHNLTYNIRANGSYTFQVVDLAGNVTTKTVIISNIDETPPSLFLSHEPTEFTNKKVTIKIEANDIESGVSKIQLHDGTIVKGNKAEFIVEENGVYHFSVTDNVGHTTTKSYEISNIDRNPPIVNINETNRTNNQINIRLKYSDPK